MTTGWVGFGIAEQTSGTMGVRDRYVLSQRPGTRNSFEQPINDNCQDWKLIKGEEINGTTILELSRKIDT